MNRAFQTVGLVGAIAVAGLLAGAGSAQAGGCGGGGSARGGYGGGHFFSRAAYAPSGCGGNCNMMGMSMAAGQAPAASMQGMNMGAPAPWAAPAAPVQGVAAAAQAPAAAASYTCPMHPSVVSAGPGMCPYCRMALQRR